MAIQIITFPVFCGYVVHVETASDLTKVFAKYPQTKNADVTDTRAVTVHVKDKAFSFLFLRTTASVSDIAHECYHVVRGMLRYMGVELDNECVAYHLGWLTQEVFDFVNHKRRKISKITR